MPCCSASVWARRGSATASRSPHGKLAKVSQIFGVFARVEKPIDFEALDGEPVDLILLLVAPESAGADHLKALARAARLLRSQPDHREAPRQPAMPARCSRSSPTRPSRTRPERSGRAPGTLACDARLAHLTPATGRAP